MASSSQNKQQRKAKHQQQQQSKETIEDDGERSQVSSSASSHRRSSLVRTVSANMLAWCCMYMILHVSIMQAASNGPSAKEYINCSNVCFLLPTMAFIDNCALLHYLEQKWENEQQERRCCCIAAIFWQTGPEDSVMGCGSRQRIVHPSRRRG